VATTDERFGALNHQREMKAPRRVRRQRPRARKCTQATLSAGCDLGTSYSRFASPKVAFIVAHGSCSRDRTINRYYDPVTGQFISVDPNVIATGAPYAYVADNPINAVDPLGLDCGWFSAICGAYDATAGAIKDAASTAWHLGADLVRFSVQQFSEIQGVVSKGITFLKGVPNAVTSYVAAHWRFITKVAIAVATIAGAIACSGTLVCGAIAAGLAMTYYTAGHAGTRSFSIQGLLIAGAEGAALGAVGGAGDMLAKSGAEEAEGVLSSGLKSMISHPIQSVKTFVSGVAKVGAGRGAQVMTGGASLVLYYKDRRTTVH
jgi:hypothetical protein